MSNKHTWTYGLGEREFPFEKEAIRLAALAPPSGEGVGALNVWRHVGGDDGECEYHFSGKIPPGAYVIVPAKNTTPQSAPVDGGDLPELVARIVDVFPMVAIVREMEKRAPGMRWALASPLSTATPEAAECLKIADWFEGYHSTVDVVRRKKIASVLRRFAALNNQATPPPASQERGDVVSISRDHVRWAADVCDSWCLMHREYVRFDDIERWEYPPGVEGLAESLREALAASPATSAAEGPKIIDLQAAHLESLRENLRHQDDGMSVFFDDAAEQAKPDDSMLQAVSRGRLRAIQRGLTLAHEWSNGTGVYGAMNDAAKLMAERLRLALSSQPGDYETAAEAEESREARMVVVERDNDGKPTVWCDPEIVDLVTALNSAGIRTVASCSGHGEQHGNIALADGRELIIAPSFEAARKMEAQTDELPELVDALIQAVADDMDNGREEYGPRTKEIRDALLLRLAGGVTVDVKSLLSLKLHRSAALGRWCWFYPNGQAFDGSMYETPQDAVEARDAALAAALVAK